CSQACVCIALRPEAHGEHLASQVQARGMAWLPLSTQTQLDWFQEEAQGSAVAPPDLLRLLATAAKGDVLGLAKAGIEIFQGVMQARAAFRDMDPAVVVGFGGYPTLPPLVAARMLGVPGIIHDANAVLGRANRFLSGRVNAIATSLPGVLDRDPALAGKATTVGTPMR
ncbi:glycosyltransferase, partial [Ralstonia pseudosolanacearum]|uniref:glycosyltransferase n=1 Tax=Ralstonia pseudosolanacearum TaxID=1310165 RepID=UPI003D186B24